MKRSETVKKHILQLVASLTNAEMHAFTNCKETLVAGDVNRAHTESFTRMEDFKTNTPIVHLILGHSITKTNKRQEVQM